MGQKCRTGKTVKKRKERKGKLETDWRKGGKDGKERKETLETKNRKQGTQGEIGKER